MDIILDLKKTFLYFEISFAKNNITSYRTEIYLYLLQSNMLLQLFFSPFVQNTLLPASSSKWVWEQ